MKIIDIEMNKKSHFCKDDVTKCAKKAFFFAYMIFFL